ncbi:MAG TPA: type I DNA topoisomerase [bacterium]|nr:type I DNA topoisomerase [bacterium]HPP29503.1 type I DNA topoisomerase [bacterium]
MEKGLVIVESPTKARTIGSILGREYKIMATMGHIRDLPENDMGVDIENNFKPKYVLIPGKRKIAANLKKSAEQYNDIFLATDEDREGEAIAWHIAHIIGKNPDEVKRVVFHEIVPDAIRKAFKSPRSIHLNLVDSQQARRVLDRIVGYTLSPFLGKGLSAGRVQSVALKLIVEREREIENFVPQIYWIVKAKIVKEGKEFFMTLVEIEEKKIEKYGLKDEGIVNSIIEDLKKGILVVVDKKEEEKKIKPYPPFITSTLQQDASIKLGFSASKTMVIAQQLYEGIKTDEGDIGLITYMRTDSPSVAKPARDQTLKYIKETFGYDYVPERPHTYKGKASAQEAHESIRPTSVLRTPEKMKPFLNEQQYKLYNLIWKRFVASQMKEAIIKNIKLFARNGKYGFFTESNEIIFDGFTKLWDIKIDSGEYAIADIQKDEILDIKEYFKEQHQTSPPPRYTEASLIKTLEKNGIGRPSTYAPTISILFNRGYVKKEKKTLIPLKIGRAVCEILEKFFPEIIKIDFSAEMEEDLDKIAEGEKKWTEILQEFYGRYKIMLERAKGKIAEHNEIFNRVVAEGRVCPRCKVPLIVKQGRYGIFLGCSNYPRCTFTERIGNAYNPRNRPEKK